jgi:hypothetical protein
MGNYKLEPVEFEAHIPGCGSPTEKVLIQKWPKGWVLTCPTVMSSYRSVWTGDRWADVGDPKVYSWSELPLVLVRLGHGN